MKKLSLIAAVAAFMFGATSASAQVKQYNFDLSYFNAIVVEGEFEVTVSQGDAYKASITIEEPFREALNCSVSGQVLKISIDDKKVSKDVKKLYKGKGAVVPVYKAVVTLPEDLAQVTLNDKSSLTATKDFNVDSFKATVTDNANLKAITVNSQFATINMSKKGVASINLTTNTLNLDIDGSATLNLNQTSKNIDAKVAGLGSNVTIHGDADKMEFAAKGNSKIILNGTIPFVNYNLSGGVSVNALNLVTEDAVVKMSSVCTLSEAASKSLSVELSGGATLNFDNSPVITIEDIKSSHMHKAANKK